MTTMATWRRMLLWGLCALGLILLTTAAVHLAIGKSRLGMRHPPAAIR
jgi:hypothetical protein